MSPIVGWTEENRHNFIDFVTYFWETLKSKLIENKMCVKLNIILAQKPNW